MSPTSEPQLGRSCRSNRVLVRVVLALLVVSCTPSLSSDARSGAPSPTDSASPEPTCLSGPRLNFLANWFFVEYNRRDLEGFLGLFNFSVSAGGGGFGEYYDNP